MEEQKYSGQLKRQIDKLEYDLKPRKKHQAVDTESSVHHEFRKGGHGLRIDIGESRVQTGSALYIDIAAAWAKVFEETYSNDYFPDAIVGIADGGTRYAKSIEGLIGNGIILLSTLKSEGEVVPNTTTEAVIADRQIQSAVLIAPTSTTGSTLAEVAGHFQNLGVKDIEVLNFWQGVDSLPFLDEKGIVYRAVINRSLPYFSPEECLSNPEGYCAREVPLVRRPQSQINI